MQQDFSCIGVEKLLLAKFVLFGRGPVVYLGEDLDLWKCFTAYNRKFRLFAKNGLNKFMLFDDNV